jgi:hypothetical protein
MPAFDACFTEGRLPSVETADMMIALTFDETSVFMKELSFETSPAEVDSRNLTLVSLASAA